MLKNVLFTILCLFTLQAVKAGVPDSLVVYLKNSGKKVSSKDSADFYRIILPPDTTADKDLYRVFEYYPNGKIKSVATSYTATDFPVLDGVCIDYFRNGKRKSTSTYKNGALSGEQTNYYPNGKVYDILKIEPSNLWYNDAYYRGYSQQVWGTQKVTVVELRDSLGNVLTSKGTGHIIVYDQDFKTIKEEGDLKNNKQEGEWKGKFADSVEYICNFHKDELKSGTAYTKSGHQYSFKKITVQPVFSDGRDEFFYFIKKNLQYPESARKRKVAGSVLVGFDVETNGTVSNVKVVRGILKSLDDEAVRVVSLSPLWVPGYVFGIPIITHNTVSVNFSPY